jgi:methylase of polypeptide subunit release factors
MLATSLFRLCCNDAQAYPPNLHHLHNRGLDFYIRISHLLAQNLLRRPSSPSPIPQVVLECGHDQAPLVEQILMEGPSGGVVERVETWVDFGGHGRVVVGWLRPKEEERGGEPEAET